MLAIPILSLLSGLETAKLVWKMAVKWDWCVILPGNCNIIIEALNEMCFLYMTCFMAWVLLRSVVSISYFHALFVHFLIGKFWKVKTLSLQELHAQSIIAKLSTEQCNMKLGPEIWLSLASISVCEYMFKIVLLCFIRNCFVCRSSMWTDKTKRLWTKALGWCVNQIPLVSSKFCHNVMLLR